MTDKKKQDIRTIDGKRIAVYGLELPVSKDRLVMREVGLITARKIERAAGVGRKDKTVGQVSDKLLDNLDKLAEQFIPVIVVEPAPFPTADYTDDDLWAIISQTYNRGALQNMGLVVDSFRPDGDGEGNSDTEPPEKADGDPVA